MRIVFDLDGTLADGRHREHFINGETKDWDAYFEACDGDVPIWPAIETLIALRALDGEHQVEIWSGRGEGEGKRVRYKTRDWLHSHGVKNITMDSAPLFFVHYTALRMRPHGDHRQDSTLKLEWLNQAIGQGYPPELVFDDRQKVVDMWRANGIPCFQVAPGDF